MGRNHHAEERLGKAPELAKVCADGKAFPCCPDRTLTIRFCVGMQVECYYEFCWVRFPMLVQETQLRESLTVTTWRTVAPLGECPLWLFRPPLVQPASVPRRVCCLMVSPVERSRRPWSGKISVSLRHAEHDSQAQLHGRNGTRAAHASRLQGVRRASKRYRSDLPKPDPARRDSR